MILLVLLHKGRGGGLSDMFGGGVSSSLGGSSVAERNLDRLTVGIGVIWFACVIALGLLLPTRADDTPEECLMAGGGNAIRGSRVGAGPMGEAERGEAAPRQAVTYFCSHGHRCVITFAVEAVVPDDLGLPQVRPAGQPGLRQPAPGAQDRAVQDPPGLREGATLREGGRRHPRRGPPPAAQPPQVRRRHLLAPRSGEWAQSSGTREPHQASWSGTGSAHSPAPSRRIPAYAVVGLRPSGRAATQQPGPGTRSSPPGRSRRPPGRRAVGSLGQRPGDRVGLVLPADHEPDGPASG